MPWIRISALTVTIVAVIAPAALASWAYVPQEVRIAEADLVVAGSIEKLSKNVKKDGREYQVGVIKAIKILKGKPAMMGDIRLAWPKPNPGGPVLSTQLPTPKIGEKSVWVLQADADLPVYWATYPTDRQPIDKLAEVEERVAAVTNVKWSGSEDGLRLAVFVEQRDLRKAVIRVDGKPVKALAQLAAYVMMKNVSDNAMHVVDYPYDKPISVELLDPAGDPIQVKLGEFGRKPLLQKHNFVKLPAGEIRTIGYGFQLGHAKTPGDYTVKLSYKNAHDGTAHGFADVWKGQTASPATKITVAK